MSIRNNSIRISAAEAEKEMQEVRVREGMCENNEKLIVTNMIKNAKNNSRVGDKLLMVVDPKMIHIPEWQREIRLSKAYSIGRNYNRYKWNEPKVLVNKNQLVIIDGQHRIYGAYKAGIEAVVVEILECPMKDAIEIFLNQTVDSTQMRPRDTFYAALIAEKPEYMQLNEMCHKHNIAIIGEKDKKNTIGTLTSITDGLKLIATPEMFDSMLTLLEKLSWNGYASSYNGKAYTAKVLRSLKKLYAYHWEEKNAMEKILLKNCKGTQYFVDNIMKKSQEQIFDYLNMIVTYELEKQKSLVVNSASNTLKVPKTRKTKSEIIEPLTH